MQFLSLPYYLELYIPFEIMIMMSLMQKILTFQMVGSTRGTPSGFGAGGNGDPPPPPPPVGIVEVLAAQTEILR